MAFDRHCERSEAIQEGFFTRRREGEKEGAKERRLIFAASLLPRAFV